MKFWITSIICVILCGCGSLTSSTTKATDPKTGITTEITKVHVYTLWDANSELTKFRNTTGQNGNGSNVWSYPSGTTIGNLNQESTSTNINQLIGIIIQAAVQGAAKAAKP